jgi:hypothetical protein
MRQNAGPILAFDGFKRVLKKLNNNNLCLTHLTLHVPEL